MRRFVLGFFATIGVLVIVLLLAGGGFFFWSRWTADRVAGNTVLTLDLTAPFPDTPPAGGVGALLFPGRRPLRDVLDAIARAGDDPRVTGLIAHLGGDDFGIAQVQELRDAIIAFRAKGKHATAFAESFGEFGPGTRSYYLATAFDDIWLQPLGLVGLIGLSAEEPFFRGTFDKLGIVPRFDHREQYKTAMNMLTETAMTPAHREETTAILASDEDQIVSGIAAGRKLDPATVRTLIDRGPLMTEEALTAHLIDHIGYEDEATAALRARLGGRAHLMKWDDYLDAAGRPNRQGPVIALIYADGLITTAGGRGNPVTGSQVLSAARVVKAFNEAARDPKVRAILFRIDSPGGSVVASEAIWRATVAAERAGKPVIASMGDVAGSGGYYIAAAADKIVAEPGTLTGSIGVLAGKFLIGGLSGKLGVTWDGAAVGKDAAMFSPIEDFTPAEHDRFEAFLDQVYDGFKAHVAQGRKMSAEAVEAVAKGRVWTGADAKTHGLVDALGGYQTALALAKSAAHLPAAQPVTLELVPAPHDTARTLLARALGHAETGSGAGSLADLATLAEPLIARLQSMTAGALVMPPLGLH